MHEDSMFYVSTNDAIATIFLKLSSGLFQAIPTRWIHSERQSSGSIDRRNTMKGKKEQKTISRPKTNRKAVSQSATAKNDKRKQESKRTIKQVVIESFSGNSAITNNEMIAAVKTEFPISAFDARHAAWYRTQARKGLLTGTPIEIPAQPIKHSKTEN
jgi:hypothetical protein